MWMPTRRKPVHPNCVRIDISVILAGQVCTLIAMDLELIALIGD
jgi:hypothetical protein